MSAYPVRLPAIVTLHTCAILIAALPKMVADADTVVQFDAAAVCRFDSVAISLLLHARRLTEASGRRFELLSAPADFLDLASLYGVEDLLLPTSPQGGERLPFSLPMRDA